MDVSSRGARSSPPSSSRSGTAESAAARGMQRDPLTIHLQGNDCKLHAVSQVGLTAGNVVFDRAERREKGKIKYVNEIRKELPCQHEREWTGSQLSS